MLELKSFCKTYNIGNRTQSILKDINLTVNEGEIVGLIGQSGAGKSTLVRCIDLLETPTSGEIWLDHLRVDNRSKAEKRQIRKKIGLIFQSFNLLNTLNVIDNIALPLKLNHVPSAEINHKVHDMIERVGLTEQQQQFPMQLSGGQKQRVAIARALITHPSLLLLDEATSALDPQTTIVILDLLKSLHQQEKRSILMVTHDMAAAKRVCERIYILHEGEMVESGGIAQIFATPKHPETKKLVKASLFSPENDFPTLTAKLTTSATSCVIVAEFFGPQTDAPIISNLIHAFYPNVKVNILQGKIEQLYQDLFGVLVLELQGSPTEFEKAIAFLNEHKVFTEILGYRQ